MAAGSSSRFVPLSIEKPKGLLEVRGEVLIERQIRQLKEAAVNDIIVITGFKADSFAYLEDKFGVTLVNNEDYSRYNNTSSIIRIVDRLSNTFICCSDHYFSRNVFLDNSDDSYYAALYANGKTNEYCLLTDNDDYIRDVTIGGANSWYMAGHVYLTDSFSHKFREILKKEYSNVNARKGYWEDIFIRHIKELQMKMKRYANNDILEFDTLDELRRFDGTYISDTRSSVLKSICKRMSWLESDVSCFNKLLFDNNRVEFSLMHKGDTYYIVWTPERITIDR